LVHHIKEITKPQGVRGQGAEKDIRTKAGGRTGDLRKLCKEELFDFKTSVNIIWVNKRMRVR
jgi:hypothetical protein